MMKKYKKLFLTACFVVALALTQVVSAANPALNTLDNVAGGTAGPFQTPTGDSKTQLFNIIGTVVSVFLGLVGIIFLLLMIFAGYNWMTAHGDEEKVGKAKSIITQTIIGVIIVVGAYASWRFLFSKLFF